MRIKITFKKKFLVFILFIIIGCQNRNDIKNLKEFKAQTELEIQNEKLARRYIEIINKGNFENIKEVLSFDYRIYSPSGYPTPTSREKLIDNYKAAQTSFSEFIWDIEDLIVSKDKVVCRIIVQGSLKGQASDHLETNKKFKFSLMTILRIENQKIVEEWQEDDQLGFARQLGMELKPKEEGI